MAKTKRYPHEIIKSMVDAVNKFDGFVMGIGGSNNYFTFNADNKQKDAIRKIFITDDKDPKEEKVLEDQDKLEEYKTLRRSFMTTLLDSSVGGYYTTDIIEGNTILAQEGVGASSLNPATLPNYIKILADTAVNGNKNIPTTVYLEEGDNKTPPLEGKKKSTRGSISRMIQEGNLSFKIKDAIYIGSEGIREDLTKADERATAEDIAINQGGDKEAFISDLEPELQEFFLEEFAPGLGTIAPLNVNEAGFLSNPSLTNRKFAAYVIKDSEFNFGNRRKEYLSLFFNGIPPIEMSRCTPYVEVTFYHQNFSYNKEQYLDPAAYMSFYSEIDSETGKLKASSFSGKTRPVSDTYQEENISRMDIGYMDMFTSPQTMVNANINSDGAFSLFEPPKTSPFNNALEPFAPQATLTGLSIATTSGGFGFTSEKKGSMNLVIHDRSRLKQFASIVSINQLAKSRVKISFGWSHPEGGVGSENTIGKFLDSLKNTQHYTLTSSNMRFQGNSVEVDVEIVSMGNHHVDDMPAAAGVHIPLRVIGPAINTIIETIIEDAKRKRGILDTSKIGMIHPQLDLLSTAANSTEAMVSSLEFNQLLEQMKKNTDGKLNVKIIQKVASILGIKSLEGDFKVISDFVKAVDDEVKGDESANKNAETAKSVTASIRRQTGEILRGKYETLFHVKDDGQLLQPDYFTESCLVKEASPGCIKETKNKFFNKAEYVSLGKCIANFVAAPMLSTGEYSEVQLFFYPMNQSCGGARRFTTASLPIAKSELAKIFEVEKEEEGVESASQASIDLGTISAVGMFNKLASLLGSYDLSAYGLTAIASAAQKMEFDLIYEASKSESKQKTEKNLELILNTYFAKYGEKAEEQKKAYDAEKDEKKKDQILKTAISSYIKEQAREQKNKLLKKIYATDLLDSPVDDNTFKFPTLNMTFEVVTPIKPPGKVKPVSFFFAKDAYYDEDETGSYGDGRILRIHITDDSNVGSSTVDLASQILFDGAKNIDKKSESALASIISEGVNNLSDAELKEYIKRHYATVIYGAANSTVKSINVTANTSDRIAQAKMMTFEKNRRAKSITKNTNVLSDSIRIIPASIDLQILGCPFIERGNQIFIDMGTNTDLDNTYTVNSVTHTISKGDFTTSLGLVVSHQGTIINARGNLLQKIKKTIEIENAVNPTDLII